MPDAPTRITFNYASSPAFRAIHVDGAIGGITPRGFIHIAVYNERAAIPSSETYDLLPQGTLSEKPIASTSAHDIIREIDVDLILTKQTAIEVRDWLTKQIDLLTQLEASQSSKNV